MAPTDPTKKAVVLSGGGANGAYEIGVLKALTSGLSPATARQPLDADIFTGTSVGAYNAAVMVAETTRNGGCLEATSHLETLWMDRIAENPEGCDNGAYRLRVDFLDYLKPRCVIGDPLKPFREIAEDTLFFAEQTARRSARFLTGTDPLAQRALHFFDLASAFSTGPLHSLVEDTVNLNDILAPEAKTLKVCATNWNQGKAEIFRNKRGEDKPGGNYTVRQLTESIGHRAILASTAIPSIFPAVRIPIDGSQESFYYVDGGVLMNTPLSPAIKAGATEIHVVYFEPKLEPLPENYLASSIDTINRLLFIAIAQTVSEDIDEVSKVNLQTVTAKTITPIVQEMREEAALLGPSEESSAGVESSVRRTREFIDKLATRNEITVHRHYPQKSLGGVLGLLDFKRGRMAELIELGFNETVEHDCQRNRCVLTG